MADTVRSLSSLQTILADNTSGGISAQDVRDMLVSTYLSEAQANLENGKTTTDTPDDDFSAGSLDGKWTVVDGASGTVAMDPSTPVDVYDLTTREELLIQISDGNLFKIRQDYTLPDGNSLTLCFTPSSNVQDTALDDYNLLFVLNDNDTDFSSGSRQHLGINMQPPPRIVWYDGTTIVDNSDQNDIGHRMYFRVNRDTLTYSWFYSYDGATWVPMHRKTESGALDNIWIVGYTNATTNVRPVGITAVHWIRQGSNNIDPW
jgi:hypothetical protein